MPTVYAICALYIAIGMVCNEELSRLKDLGLIFNWIKEKEKTSDQTTITRPFRELEHNIMQYW